MQSLFNISLGESENNIYYYLYLLAVPVIINEWLGTTETLVGSGGMVSILVSEIYNDTNAVSNVLK